MSDRAYSIAGSAVTTLMSQSLGPTRSDRMQVWRWLSSFQNWPELMAGLKHTKMLDEGDPGRGTRIRLQWSRGFEIWEITHWNPGQRLTLQCDDRTCVRAYQISIESGSEPRTYLLSLQFQAKYRRFWRILAPVLNLVEMKRGQRRFGALLLALSRLQNQV